MVQVSVPKLTHDHRIVYTSRNGYFLERHWPLCPTGDGLEQGNKWLRKRLRSHICGKFRQGGIFALALIYIHNKQLN